MTVWREGVDGVTEWREVTEEKGGADGVTEWREVIEVTEGKRGTDVMMIEKQGALVVEEGGGNLVMEKKDG